MHILSVNVGPLRTVTINQREIETGIYKLPVEGPVNVNHYGLESDVRIEPRKMGLEHSAVYAYPHEHYAYWEKELEHAPFPLGQFGENLTVTGLLEDEVRIGDIYRFGNTVLQVAHPRIPCAKLNAKMGLRFATRFLLSRKVGYYFRVLQQGTVTRGDTIALLERDPDSPTMDDFVRVSQFEYWDIESLQHLLHAKDLMEGWREVIAGKLERALKSPGWEGLRELEVTDIRKECADTVSLTLQCARGRPLPTFHGGQLLTVVLGRHSTDQHRRAYALSGNPHDTHSYRITVRRMSAPEVTMPDGIMSSRLVNLHIGDHILCGGPTGGALHTADQNRERIPVLISHGLGIAPTLSLLYEFDQRHSGPLHLLHLPTERDPQGLLQEVDTLLARNPSFVRTAVPQVDTVTFVSSWVAQHIPLDRCAIHLAGPRSYTDPLAAKLREIGIPNSVLQVQSFN